ncbi:hypothetical protein WA158_008164 [Blastocystis sp. Blastoise]
MENIPYGLREFPAEAFIDPKPLIGLFNGNQLDENVLEPLTKRLSDSCNIIHITPNSLPVPKNESTNNSEEQHIFKYSWFEKHLKKLPGTILMAYKINFSAPESDWESVSTTIQFDYKALTSKTEHQKVQVYITLFNEGKNDFSDDIKVQNSLKIEKLCQSLSLDDKQLIVIYLGNEDIDDLYTIAFSDIESYTLSYYSTYVKSMKKDKRFTEEQTTTCKIINMLLKIGYISEFIEGYEQKTLNSYVKTSQWLEKLYHESSSVSGIEIRAFALYVYYKIITFQLRINNNNLTTVYKSLRDFLYMFALPKDDFDYSPSISIYKSHLYAITAMVFERYSSLVIDPVPANSIIPALFTDNEHSTTSMQLYISSLYFNAYTYLHLSYYDAMLPTANNFSYSHGYPSQSTDFSIFPSPSFTYIKNDLLANYICVLPVSQSDCINYYIESDHQIPYTATLADLLEKSQIYIQNGNHYVSPWFSNLINLENEINIGHYEENVSKYMCILDSLQNSHWTLLYSHLVIYLYIYAYKHQDEQTLLTLVPAIVSPSLQKYIPNGFLTAAWTLYLQLIHTHNITTISPSSSFSPFLQTTVAYRNASGHCQTPVDAQLVITNHLPVSIPITSIDIYTYINEKKQMLLQGYSYESSLIPAIPESISLAFTYASTPLFITCHTSLDSWDYEITAGIENKVINNEYKYISMDIDKSIQIYVAKENQYVFLSTNEMKVYIEDVCKEVYTNVYIESNCEDKQVILLNPHQEINFTSSPVYTYILQFDCTSITTSRHISISLHLHYTQHDGNEIIFDKQVPISLIAPFTLDVKFAPSLPSLLPESLDSHDSSDISPTLDDFTGNKVAIYMPKQQIIANNKFTIHVDIVPRINGFILNNIQFNLHPSLSLQMIPKFSSNPLPANTVSSFKFAGLCSSPPTTLSDGDILCKWTIKSSSSSLSLPLPSLLILPPPLHTEIVCPSILQQGVVAQFTIFIYNNTTSIQDIQVDIKDMTTYIFRGPLHTVIQILPRSVYTLKYDIVPILTGNQTIPTVNLVSTKYNMDLFTGKRSSFVNISEYKP